MTDPRTIRQLVRDLAEAADHSPPRLVKLAEELFEQATEHARALEEAQARQHRIREF